MAEKATNIHPIFDGMLQRSDKENLLNQKSLCLWMTGLSGSGKSTIAKGVEQKLHELGYLVQILDGDNIRTGINSNLGFSEEDRIENIRRIAEVTKLFINCGVITINSFVSPTKDIRDLAAEIIGKTDFFEVYINASFEECEKRDVKGLYKKARAGEIKNFTGLDAPFEAPENAALEILTAGQSIEASVATVVDFVLQKIELKK
ncbi:MAG: adenylyl-sulfate kinase [Bacteroidetes bacterium]|jgi:adenylylsulfate kinase|nr:adenylyl-sulfate kinase [Bacteroidota bacterium]MBP7255827.1 adenylyl-sulfate kinase [Chitinophagales bacterium]MBK7139701.1 adenylyl-sulfate kinase [Bacteroidota bacterium]MBK7506070.1 adenylyl-sulfate kinase [Bacteroidota bacterium]MBK7639573.1 adenylyl-sulfate kinase [Bacteroidota bacterium]